MRAYKRHRGSVYLAVLGASMLVTILGVSALLAVRLQRQTLALDDDAAAAALAARSAVELALRQVQNDGNWRANHTHDTWTADVAIGGARGAYKFVSTTGGALAAGPDDPVRVVGRGSAGGAVRLESVLLRPVDLRGLTPGANVLENPSFNSGSSGWGIVGSLVNAVLDLLTTRTPPGALTISGRSSSGDGASQVVTTKLIEGMTYDASVWGRSALLTTDTLRLRLVVRSTGSGTQTYNVATVTMNSLTWRQASGTVTPRWKGHLVDARWEVTTTSNSYSFTIDDAYFGIAATSPRPHAVDPASWRQELP